MVLWSSRLAEGSVAGPPPHTHARRTRALHVLLLPLLLAVHAATLTHAARVRADDAGVWRDRTDEFFPIFSGSGDGTRAGPVVGLTDWLGDLSPGLLVVGMGNVSGGATHVELWGSTVSYDGTRVLSRQWAAGAPVAPGVSVASAVTVDLRRSGALDVLVQGTDGELYVMAGTGGEPVGPPLAAQKLSITVPTPSVNTTPSPAAHLTDARRPSPTFSTRLRYAASPQVAIGLLASAYPSILFVNEEGALVELRWRGRGGGRDGAAAPSGEARGDEDLTYAYEAHEIVPATLPSTHLQLGSGAPAGVGRGLLELDPSSLVMADVDGDCVAELLYVVRDHGARTVSVYAYQPHGFHDSTTTHMRLLMVSEAHDELGRLSIADVDGDGAVDLIFPTRRSSSDGRAERGGKDAQGYTGVRVYYGTPLARDGCRRRPAAPAEVLFDTADDAIVAVDEEACGSGRGAPTPVSQPLRMPDSTVRPLILRAGDYNRDGRVDLLAPSTQGPLVLTATGRRGSAAFQCAYLDETRAVAADMPAYTTGVPFFAALSEDAGRLDVVVTPHERLHTPGPALPRNLVYVNAALPERNYYLIACTLNGVQPARKLAGRRRASSGFGLAQPSASFHLTWEDARMRRRWHVGVQLGHYVGHALQPPRTLVGLGETFSYVRGFTVGIPAAAQAETRGDRRGGEDKDGGEGGSAVRVHARQWPSYLVPNSQVFAVQYPIDTPSLWRLQLYLPTSRYRLLLGVALLVALVGLGVPIVVLRWREMRVDYWEWKRH